MARNITAYLANNSSSRNDVNPFRSPKNSRVGSATRSVSQLTNRVSLQDFSTKMKARKIQLYRNGDPFFKGVTMAITQERFRTFNSLLSEVNKSAICDPSILQKGVRHIFSLQGEPIYDLDQLKDGQSYVCSSTPVFKRLKYESINSFNWYTSLRKVTPRNYEKLDVGERSPTPDYVPSQPKMVVVIRAGPRPRNMVRMLLNRRTATSFDQVLTHLASALNMKTGTIRKMYMMTGPQVQDLSGFFLDNRVFVAFESEKFSLDDLQMSEEEAKFVESACANTRTAASEIVTPVAPIRKPDQSNSSRRVRSTASHPDEKLENPIPILAKSRIGRVLAQGDFVLVNRCCEKSRVTRLALKIIDKSQLTQQEQSAVDREVSLIRCISHTNVLQLMNELHTTSELRLIMEFIKTNGPGQEFGNMDGSRAGKLGDFGLATEVNKLLYKLCGTVAVNEAVLDNINDNHKNQSDRVPVSWPKLMVKLVEQDNTSRNFQKFQSMFLDGDVSHYKGIAVPVILGKMKKKVFNLKKLFQIQNRPWLERYLLRKRHIMQEVGAENLNEWLLLHGTSEESALLIAAANFNRSFSNKDGRYGVGNYFGKILGHILNYTDPEGNGWICILICRVLGGKQGVGKKGDKQPPTYGDQGKRCHSSVDCVDDPTIVVTYDDDAVYPCFLAYGQLRDKR